MSVILPADWDNVGGSGKSMNQLGDEWWIRAYGTPEDSNPLVKDDVTDPRGRRGSVERANEFNADVPDPIFFLGGSFESRSEDLPKELTRTIVVPEGAVLVLPTINGALPDPVNEEDLPASFPSAEDTRESFENAINNFPVIAYFQEPDGDLLAVDSTVTVDGELVGDFAESERNTDYRRESPEGGFSYVLPEDNWTGKPPQTVEPAVADGYWFAYDTKSLLSGKDHTVNFTGDYYGVPRDELPEPPPEELPFALDVTYNILNPIEGNNRKNKLRGTHGKDYIDGKNGKDKLLGFGGDDLLIGGNGKDTIDGGIGDDELWGDNGKDTFIFKRGYGQDTIFDFERGEVVKIKGFSEIPDPVHIELDSGVSAAQIDFGNKDILTLVGVELADLSVNPWRWHNYSLEAQ